MKYLVFICLSISLSISCNVGSDEDWNKIKKTNNYAFIENYILGNPDSEHFEEAINQILKLKEQYDDTSKYHIYPNYYGCNAIRIIIKRDSLIYYQDVIIYSNDIEMEAFEYLLNRDDSPYFADKEHVVDKDLNKLLISKGHFFIILDDSLNIDVTRKVIKSLSSAFNSYKDYLASKYYHIHFIELEDIESRFIDSSLYNRVQFFTLNQHENFLRK